MDSPAPPAVDNTGFFFLGRPTGLPFVPASGPFLVPLGLPGPRFGGRSEDMFLTRLRTCSGWGESCQSEQIAAT